MYEQIKKAIDLKSTLTIAAGVFGGLFLYRLFMWSHAWWQELHDYQRDDILSFAILSVAIGVAHYGARRLVTKLNQATPPTTTDRAYWRWSRRKHAIRSLLASVFSFSMIVTGYLEAWVSFWVLVILGVTWIAFRFRARVRRVKDARIAQLDTAS